VTAILHSSIVQKDKNIKIQLRKLYYINLGRFLSNVDLSCVIPIVITECIARLVNSWSEVLSRSSNRAGRSRRSEINKY